MNIAIVDDFKPDREHLRTLLNIFFEKYDFEPSIFEFENAESFLNIFEKDKFDLCFFDIYMDGINGMAASRLVYDKDPFCILIFLTVSTEYIAAGYDVRAWRYLLKPITGSTLNQILPACVDQITLSKRRLKVLVDRQEVHIPFSKILYMISANRNTEIHMEKQVLTLSSHLPFSQTAEPLLRDYRFLSCGQGLVVNMAHITDLTSEGLLMDNGNFIFISPRKLPQVKKSYLDFSFTYL